MDSDTKLCPVCAETIKAAALKCRYCNSDLAAFAESRRLETEEQLFSGHPAAIYSIGQVMPFVVLLAAAGAFLYFAKPVQDIVYLYTFAAVVGIAGLIFLGYFWKSYGIRYTITSQRIKLESGVFSKVSESLELFRIDHFELHKPIGMRLLGNASLRIFTSDAELGRFFIYGIPGVEALGERLRECQLRERSRRGLTTFVKA